MQASSSLLAPTPQSSSSLHASTSCAPMVAKEATAKMNFSSASAQTGIIEYGKKSFKLSIFEDDLHTTSKTKLQVQNLHWKKLVPTICKVANAIFAENTMVSPEEIISFVMKTYGDNISRFSYQTTPNIDLSIKVNENVISLLSELGEQIAALFPLTTVVKTPSSSTPSSTASPQLAMDNKAIEAPALNDQNFNPLSPLSASYSSVSTSSSSSSSSSPSLRPMTARTHSPAIEDRLDQETPSLPLSFNNADPSLVTPSASSLTSASLQPYSPSSSTQPLAWSSSPFLQAPQSSSSSSALANSLRHFHVTAATNAATPTKKASTSATLSIRSQAHDVRLERQGLALAGYQQLCARNLLLQDPNNRNNIGSISGTRHGPGECVGQYLGSRQTIRLFPTYTKNQTTDAPIWIALRVISGNKVEVFIPHSTKFDELFFIDSDGSKTDQFMKDVFSIQGKQKPYPFLLYNLNIDDTPFNRNISFERSSHFLIERIVNKKQPSEIINELQGNQDTFTLHPLISHLLPREINSSLKKSDYSSLVKEINNESKKRLSILLLRHEMYPSAKMPFQLYLAKDSHNKLHTIGIMIDDNAAQYFLPEGIKAKDLFYADRNNQKIVPVLKAGSIIRYFNSSDSQMLNFDKGGALDLEAKACALAMIKYLEERNSYLASDSRSSSTSSSSSSSSGS